VTRSDRRPVVWVVHAGDGDRLGAVLARVPSAGPHALDDGRVFVDGCRAASREQPVAPGQRIEVAPRRSTPPALTVLGERAGVVAVDKPAGMPTEPDRHGSRGSLVYRLAEEIGAPPDTLHALNRLDLGVSGLVLVARTREARCLVQEARAAGRLEHRYLGIVAHPPASRCGTFTDDLPGRRRPGRTPAAPRSAETRFACVADADLGAARIRLGVANALPVLVVFQPVTGRTHQIRLHASGGGAPLVGDRAHGGPTRLLGRDGSVSDFDRIALHAAWVRLTLGRGIWLIEAPPPRALAELWLTLGGKASDFSAALRDRPA
jgi:23S rRNA pseudouridine1911/1915/1917 synthase